MDKKLNLPDVRQVAAKLANRSLQAFSKKYKGGKGLNKKITFWNINFIYTSRTLGNTLIYEKIQKPTFQSYILSSKRVCIFVPI